MRSGLPYGNVSAAIWPCQASGPWEPPARRTTWWGMDSYMACSSSVASPWRLLASGSTLLPDSADAMAWTIADHGFEMGLSPRVPALIAGRLAPWLDSWLAAQGLDRAAIGSWALHPGGPRLLEAVRDCLHLPATAIEPSTAVLRECGNMSSATILFILDRLRLAEAPLPFGPGLCVEAALLG